MEKNYLYLLHQLDELSDNTGNTYGLFNGKTGLCMAYFLLADTARSAEDKIICQQKARALLDEISDNIGAVGKLCFSEGLAGIGWGIEWLVQNGYVDANTDDILEDLDDELYKTVVFSRSPGIALSDGTLGKAMYFLKRLMAENPDPDRCRIICIKECMILLIDELNAALFNEETGLLVVDKICQPGDNLNDQTPASLTPSAIIETGQTLVFLAKIVSNSLNIEIIENMISSILTFIRKFDSGYKTGTHPETDAARDHLLYSWQIAATLLRDTHGYEEAITKSGKKYVLPETGKYPRDQSAKIFEWFCSYHTQYDSRNSRWQEAWLLQ